MTEASKVDGLTEARASWIGGLIFALSFDADGRGRMINDADAALEALPGSDGWLWLHFNLSDMRSQNFIARQSGLPEDVRTLLLDDEDRHALAGTPEAFALVLSDFETEFDRNAGFEPSRLRLAFSGRLVISVRRHPLHCVDKVKRSLVSGRAVKHPAMLIGLLGDTFADASSDHIESFADRFDDVEDAVIAGLRDAGDYGVARMRRTLLRLHREVAPMRSLMRRLTMFAADAPETPAAVAASEAGRLLLSLEGLDGEVRDLQARARLIREEIDALASAETNRQLFILSVLSALFLPATLVTGLFGMNTHDLPFESSAGGFWYALILAALATASVVAIIRYVGRQR